MDRATGRQNWTKMQPPKDGRKVIARRSDTPHDEHVREPAQPTSHKDEAISADGSAPTEERCSVVAALDSHASSLSRGGGWAFQPQRAYR